MRNRPVLLLLATLTAVLAPALAPAPAAAQIIFAGGFETGTLTAWTRAECDVGATANEGGPGELDFCILEFPLTFAVPAGDPSPPISGRVFAAGLTEPPGFDPNLRAEVGAGPATTSPIHPADRCLWRFSPAAWQSQEVNDDRYTGIFNTRIQPGDYPYCFRFSLDGERWTYCDDDGAGAAPGFDFSAAQVGTYTAQ